MRPYIFIATILFLLLFLLFLPIPWFPRLFWKPRFNPVVSHSIPTSVIWNSDSTSSSTVIPHLGKDFVPHIYNPSITKIPEGWLVAARVGTSIQSGASFLYHRYVNSQSQIVLLLFDPEFRVNLSYQILSLYLTSDQERFQYHLEDPRIDYQDGTLVICGTRSDYPSSCQVIASKGIWKNRIFWHEKTHVIPQNIQQREWKSKNWTPFFYRNEFLVVTDIYPTFKVRHLTDGHLVRQYPLNVPEFSNRIIHNGTSPRWLPSRQFYIIGIHNKVSIPLQIRTSFLLLSSTLEPQFYSPFLTFNPQSTFEFCSGLEVINDQTLVVGVGDSDQKAVLYRVSLVDLDRLWKPILGAPAPPDPLV